MYNQADQVNLRQQVSLLTTIALGATANVRSQGGKVELDQLNPFVVSYNKVRQLSQIPHGLLDLLASYSNSLPAWWAAVDSDLSSLLIDVLNKQQGKTNDTNQ